MGRIMGQNVSINRDIYKHKETSSSKEHWVNLGQRCNQSKCLSKMNNTIVCIWPSRPMYGPMFFFVFWRPYTGAFYAAQVHINDL